MAATADSTSNNHSTRSSGFSDEGITSHQLRRKNLSSPWAYIVRGDTEAVPAGPSSPSLSPATALQDQIPDSEYSPVKTSSSSPDNFASDGQLEIDNETSNVARAKKPAWNKPSNGVVELGPVMGAVSWPALSESTKSLPKSSTDSLKGLSDGSISIPQGPVIASSPQKQSTNNTNANSIPNHAFPVRQKSMKRGGGGSGPANGITQPPPPLPPPVMETPNNNKSGKPAPVVPESAPKDHGHKSNNWETGPRGGFVSQSHGGNDQPQQRNSFRRGNGGSNPRGDGPHHNNYGGRRDPDRGNYEWNSHSHRSFNGRDVHMQQQRVIPRGFIRPPPPPNSTTFISPPPVQQFGGPMGFPDMTSPVFFVPASPGMSGMPFIPHPPPPHAMFFPAPDPQLRAMLVRQIDYYFSPENLCKDIFLRQNMDEQGWVSASLISTFNRVSCFGLIEGVFDELFMNSLVNMVLVPFALLLYEKSTCIIFLITIVFFFSFSLFSSTLLI
uniref:HTH La-type RNA-binding domain-containing protein n=1 Tax=Nelumbo nucifera TaxID=4432 RepID=A0A822ZV41_NELNU|nr:TPA_asm: hypothetical protein HUJ06_016673 [Nelumbo nucifera]